MNYDLQKDELGLGAEPLERREHLIAALGYRGYTYCVGPTVVVATLVKDELRPAGRQAVLDSIVAARPQEALEAVRQYGLSDAEAAEVVRRRPDVIPNSFLLHALLGAPPGGLGSGNLGAHPQTAKALFEHVDRNPKELGDLMNSVGRSASADQIDRILDLKEKHGIYGPVTALMRAPGLEDRHIDRVVSNDSRHPDTGLALYGRLADNLKPVTGRLTPAQINTVIHGDRFFPELAAAENFGTEHMRAVIGDPRLTAGTRAQALQRYYGQLASDPHPEDVKQNLDTAEVSKFVNDASTFSGVKPETVQSIIVDHARRDPKVLDQIGAPAIAALMGNGGAHTAVELARSTGGHATNELNAVTAPRVARLLRHGGSAAAVSVEPQTWSQLMASPHVGADTRESLRRYQAQNFWRDYEDNVRPSHFAAIQKWQHGSPTDVEIVDHRGKRGSSASFPGIENALGQHAHEVQEKVLADPDLPIRDINGVPHVLVYRGVAGNYAQKIIDALKGGAKGITVPTINFSSWSTNPHVADSFADRRITDQPWQGLIMRRWMPVKNIIHSGFHKLEAGHAGLHPQESELIFDHRDEPEMSFSSKDIDVSHADPGTHAALHAAGHINDSQVAKHRQIAEPHMKSMQKSEEGYARIALTDEDHWLNFPHHRDGAL